MNLWLFKAIRIIVLSVAILIVGFLTFDKVLKEVEPQKPPINLIPEEIKAAHFVNSYPSHNQFLATVPPAIVINFDTALTSAKATMYINGKPTEQKLEKSARSIKIPQAIAKTANVEDGIYLIKYQACFGDDCTQGQFAYHIDSFRGQKFSNQTMKLNVEIVVEENSISIPNMVVDDHTVVTWNNLTSESIEIRSAPLDFNNAYLPLNSGEIKKGESFKLQLPTRGEYLWYLKANPTIQGRIIVS